VSCHLFQCVVPSYVKTPVPERLLPPPEAITEPPVDGPVTLDAGPTCGGPLAEVRVAVA